MSGQSYFAPGQWNVQCFRCGFKYKSSEVRRQWQGYYVCMRCWEPRQPQDFVRGIPDNPGVPFAQPFNWVFVGVEPLAGLTMEDGSTTLVTETAERIITE